MKKAQKASIFISIINYHKNGIVQEKIGTVDIVDIILTQLEQPQIKKGIREIRISPTA